MALPGPWLDWRQGTDPSGQAKLLSLKPSGNEESPELYPARALPTDWSRAPSLEPQCQGSVTEQPSKARPDWIRHVRARSPKHWGWRRGVPTTTAIFCACARPPAFRKRLLGQQPTHPLGQYRTCACSAMRVEGHPPCSSLCPVSPDTLRLAPAHCP